MTMTLWTALAQPLTGAFIGYLTNSIAIRMLFRPHRPWHIFGWRVPLTPGLIPAKRHELAASIGEMVGRELLTSAAIGRTVSGTAFQAQLRALLLRQVDALCDRDLPALERLLAGNAATLEANNAALATAVAGAVDEAWGNYLAGERAASDCASVLGRLAEELDGTALAPVLSAFLAKVLAGSGEAAGKALSAFLRRAGADGLRLGDLAPTEFAERLQALVVARAPQILERAADAVLAGENRPELSRALLALVEQLLQSLGPVGAVAQGFFESKTFSRRIDRYVEKHGDELRAWITAPAQRARLAQALREGVDSFLAKRLEELLHELEPGQLDALCFAAGDRILVALRGGPALEALAASLAQSLAGTLRGEAGEESATHLLILLRSGSGRRLVREALEKLTRRGLSHPLGRLATHLPATLRAQIADTLLVHLGRLLPQEVPGLVRALNIRELTRDKVDSLDLVQLERLLLGIMAEQFRYINWFGALLGGLIGLVNLALFVW